jgi:GT2 family glycosyltransferase
MSDTARTWVVLVNYNGTDDTRKCLASLAGQPASVVVIDNASKQDDCAALRAEFPWAHVVRSEVNGGWAGGNNRGMEYALARGADLLILLNNDTIVRNDFVTQLVAAADAHPGYGVLGPVIRFLDEPDKIQTMGTAFNRPGPPGFFTVIDVVPTNASPPAVVPIDIVNGCCLMTRRAVTDTIGLIDERYFLVHEESDFCLRASAAGFPSAAIAVDPVLHKGSSSFKREGQKLQRYYDARNLVPLLRAHGGRGRTRLAGWKAYAKYVYYRYALEREAKTPAAEAVLEGVYDGLVGRTGPKTDRPRWGLWWLRAAAGLVWRVKG